MEVRHLTALGARRGGQRSASAKALHGLSEAVRVGRASVMSRVDGHPRELPRRTRKFGANPAGLVGRQRGQIVGVSACARADEADGRLLVEHRSPNRRAGLPMDVGQRMGREKP